jgi:hypothetical protein
VPYKYYGLLCTYWQSRFHKIYGHPIYSYCNSILYLLRKIWMSCIASTNNSTEDLPAETGLHGLKKRLLLRRWWQRKRESSTEDEPSQQPSRVDLLPRQFVRNHFGTLLDSDQPQPLKTASVKRSLRSHEPRPDPTNPIRLSTLSLQECHFGQNRYYFTRSNNLIVSSSEAEEDNKKVATFKMVTINNHEIAMKDDDEAKN